MGTLLNPSGSGEGIRPLAAIWCEVGSRNGGAVLFTYNKLLLCLDVFREDMYKTHRDFSNIKLWGRLGCQIRSSQGWRAFLESSCWSTGVGARSAHLDERHSASWHIHRTCHPSDCWHSHRSELSCHLGVSEPLPQPLDKDHKIQVEIEPQTSASRKNELGTRSVGQEQGWPGIRGDLTRGSNCGTAGGWGHDVLLS